MRLDPVWDAVHAHPGGGGYDSPPRQREWHSNRAYMQGNTAIWCETLVELCGWADLRGFDLDREDHRRALEYLADQLEAAARGFRLALQDSDKPVRDEEADGGR